MIEGGRERERGNEREAMLEAVRVSESENECSSYVPEDSSI